VVKSGASCSLFHSRPSPGRSSKNDPSRERGNREGGDLHAGHYWVRCCAGSRNPPSSLSSTAGPHVAGAGRLHPTNPGMRRTSMSAFFPLSSRCRFPLVGSTDCQLAMVRPWHLHTGNQRGREREPGVARRWVCVALCWLAKRERVMDAT
jgi:hypothetical protein